MSKQFIVRMECQVTKILTCEGCTEEQARANPYDYAIDEREVDQVEYKVIDVEETE
jgi:hypothetical protein